MAESSILLADFVATIRSEIEKARDSHEQEAARAIEEGRRAPAALRVSEVTVELQVRAEGTETSKGGVKFWVLSGEMGSRTSSTNTQRVVLKLTPVDDIDLGE